MDDSLFELIAQQQRLSDVLQELPRWDRNQLLETLPSLLVSHEAVGDRLRSLQQKLHRDVQATTERERVAGLRSAPSPNIDDVALAILRGDLRAASDALLTLGKAKGPLERTANSVKRALQELMSGGVSAIRHLEPAIARLQGDNYEASNALRGAFLIRLGRLYRDELRSLHMAECAFNEAADMLRDQPEPLVERAELLRRRGLVERAHEVFAAATEQWPHRACGWIGLALIAQSRKVRHEAIAAGQRAADILALDDEPAVALEHVQPTYCATVHIALAKTVKEPAVAELILKRASEREPDLRYVAEICQQHARISEAGRAQQLFNAGQCYIAVGELGDGVECLEKSLELDPDHSAAALRLAQALFRSAHDVTDRAKRVSRLHRALAISNRELGENTPESHLVWGLLSRAHIIELLVEHQAHPREALWQALLDCEHALILDPKNLSYTAAVARLHRKLGMLLTAQATIKNGMDVDARHPMLLEALVLVLSTENELDEADAALAKMSESAWRTAVSAFIAQRRRESSESLRAAVEQLDVALRAIAPVNRGWIYNSIGDCFIALDEVARARERYELALEFSHRANDQVKALCWLGRWSDVVSLGEPQLRDLTNDTPLIACHVGIAYLALGQIDLARGSFERLTATVRGKRALGFIDTLTLDVPRVLALDVAASALIEEVVRRLRTAAPERRSARRELELSLENATGLARQALLLARSRIAITEEDLSGAVECVSTMENTPQKADALDRLWARCAATAARANNAALLGQVFAESEGAARHVSKYLVSAGQAARLLNSQPKLWNEPTITYWIEQHLGLVAPPPEPALPQVSLSIPEREPNADPTTIPSFVAVVTDLVHDRYGAHYPGVRVHRSPPGDPCRLWLGDQLVATREIPPEPSVASPPANAAELQQRLDEVRSGVSVTPTLDPSLQLGAWLLEHLVDRLSELTGVTEMVQLVEQWSEGDKRGRVIARNTSHLLRLWRLTRGLLAERVALRPWTAVADAADTGRGRSFPEMLNLARDRLRVSIKEELDRRGGRSVDLERELERQVLASIRHDGLRTYFATPMAELPSLINSICDLVQDPVAVVRVANTDVRLWVRRLIALTGSSVTVVTHVELADEDPCEDR